ncbi:MAG: helix-hairpin-helix domain-containing protein, partial [Candidatus Kapaibacterium sp.]
DALKGASDIIAEEIAENAELRSWIRDFFAKDGIFESKIKDEFPEGSTKYETYREFSIPVKSVSPHVMLALRRGETEGVLMLDLKFDEDKLLNYIYNKNVFSSQDNVAAFVRNAAKDGFNRLMKHSLIGEVRLDRKVFADEESVRVFEANLRQILLSSPAGMKPALGIDPGFRTGCKVAVINETGKFLEYNVIYPDKSGYEREQAEDVILSLINKYNIELIAIGNGTAGRETDEFIGKTLEKSGRQLIKVMVSEAGASVYSASKLAGEEFPELDLTVRGAISIGRRLQDPLAELVKIDPKSIGVGQYQHDVDQKLLRKKLEETVESCVNYVGVDLNTASKELLTYVSGISPAVAANIIQWRDLHGAFERRRQLLEVPKFGAKTYELAAGFLRIRDGESVLDNTGVHPESYSLVERMATDLGVPLESISKASAELKKLDIKRYITETAGEPTIRDIIAELEKPGRDPREEFKYAKFKEGITKISDLREGMTLEGVVTNITNFGAFVDIGVHQDGLVHISEMANHFVKDPAKLLRVGQIVNVMVLSVDERLSRIQLSIKRLQKETSRPPRRGFDVNDLKNKFNNG